MNKHRVSVIDGPLPPNVWQATNIEPDLVTARENEVVLHELLSREPIFHRPEFGTRREDFERMTAVDFWEVGASGRRFSRQFVLDTLEKRYEHPTQDVWEVADFHCLKIGEDTYLATYTLIQGDRVTRRSTIWRRTSDGWKIVYHQGTVVTQG